MEETGEKLFNESQKEFNVALDKIQTRIKNLLLNINNPDNVKVELIRRVENVKFTDIPIMNHITSFGKSL